MHLHVHVWTYLHLHSLHSTFVYNICIIIIIIYVYVTPPCKVYITFILTEPEGEVSINVIYTERGWCNKFISWRKPCFKGNCACVNGQAHALHALGCRQCRDSRASKKASSWKVMSCIEDKENTDPHPTKKCKLSLSLKNHDRFKAITNEKFDTMSKPQVPKNTEKSSRWAMTNLGE